MTGNIFKKKDDHKMIRSFGLAPEAISKLETLRVKHDISKSQIVEQLILNFAPKKFPYHFELQIKPVVKKRPRVTSRGTYTPEKTGRYEAEVKHALGLWWELPPIDGGVMCEIIFQFEAPKSISKYGFPAEMDIDNLAKSWLDGANGVIWKDDRQVVSVQCEKRYGFDDRVYFNFGPCAVDLTFWEKKKTGYKWIGD